MPGLGAQLPDMHDTVGSWYIRVTRERAHRGRTQFRVKSDPEFGQLSADLIHNEVRLTQLDLGHIDNILSKLITFWVIVNPEPSLTSIDPFRAAKFFFPRQFRTPSTNSFAYSQSELHDMNMNDLRLRNKSTHARGLYLLR